MPLLRKKSAGWCLACAFVLVLTNIGRADLSVASFTCDVTPPPGHPLCGGWIKPLIAVDEPLLAKGILLSDGKSRYVLCAVDWCLLQTTAHDLFRRKVAAAADTPESHVAIQTVHQHNAPIADLQAQLLIQETPAAPLHLDLSFMEAVSERVAAAVQEARQHLRPFTQIGFGKSLVRHFAANRRVRLADGQIHVRYSSTTDPVLQAAPEGLIDSWLRTVTFFDGNQPLVRLHYYATHPQSYYGDGRATSDTVGLARQQLEREEGVPQIYFTGCAGNVTAGKYNDGSPQARLELTDRILRAMKEAIAASRRVPVSSFEWDTQLVRLPLRTEPEWLESSNRHTLFDPAAPAVARLGAALNIAWRERVNQRPALDLTRLRLGPVQILNLPGEAFVEYQLYAQGLCPTGFVAVAAYGEGGPGYICTDAALAEGGYEPTESRVGAPSEFLLKNAIARLLTQGSTCPSPRPYADKSHLLIYRDRKGRDRPVTRPADWEKRRADVLVNLQLVMGALPAPAHKPPLDLRVEETVRLAHYTRQRISFSPESGDRLPAYLLVPVGLTGKGPAMLCLHQTVPEGKNEPAGLAGNPHLHYAQELAERGYVALAPDYPNFGDYRFDAYAHGYASATMKGIWNHLRCVDLLESLPEVDANRIGVIGHSLGGHNASFVAAFDRRIKVIVSSCGFDTFFTYQGGDLTGWSHAGYMPRIAAVYGKEPSQMPFDFTEVLAALAPRPVFINAPLSDRNFQAGGVDDCVRAAAPVYTLLEAANRLAVHHPPCDHDFPAEMRQSAYQWLDEWLRNKAVNISIHGRP